MKSTELERYRTLLEDKRSDLTGRVQAARSSETQPIEPDTTDLGDRAISAVSRDLLYHLSSGERKVLRRIDLAMERVESGDFGACDHCSNQIQVARLEAVPWALHCIECQELQDRGEI